MFGHSLCFAAGAIFGNSDCSNNQDVSGEVRKVVILIRGILMFLVVAGATTTVAVVTTMQDKASEDKMDLVTTIEWNELPASVSTTVETTSLPEVNITETILPVFSSTTTKATATVTTPTTTVTTTTLTTTTKPDISCEFHH